MKSNNVEIKLVIPYQDHNGKPAFKPINEYENDGIIWIEGRKGSQFNIIIHNLSPHRKLVIPTLDGIGILDGNPASLNTRGYIMSPWELWTMTGWCHSNTIIPFEFKDKKHETKITHNDSTGVLAFIIYTEETSIETTKHHYINPYETIGVLKSKGINNIKLFEKNETNIHIMSIYYDNIKNLQKYGIKIYQEPVKETRVLPNPFPAWNRN